MQKILDLVKTYVVAHWRKCAVGLHWFLWLASSWLAAHRADADFLAIAAGGLAVGSIVWVALGAAFGYFQGLD